MNASNVLKPETLKVLEGARPHAPLFSNQILAELFEAQHARGPFKVLPRTVGGYVVFDTRAALGAGVVAECTTLDEADRAMTLLEERRNALLA